MKIYNMETNGVQPLQRSSWSIDWSGCYRVSSGEAFQLRNFRKSGKVRWTKRTSNSI